MVFTLLPGKMLTAGTICRDKADLYIDEWKPDENLNYENRILVATNKNIHHGIARALFLFTVPEDLTAADIKKAQIYLSGCSHCGGGNGGQVAFYALNKPFDEDADTWNSLGGGDWDAAVYSLAVLPEGSDWNEAVNGEPPADAFGFDVTTLLKGNLEKVRDNGIMMRFYDEHQDPYTHQNVAARESKDPLDFAPYLEITARGDIPCPAEVVFSDSKDNIEALRRFRNQVLAKTEEGRHIIAFYYHWAPLLSSLLMADPYLTMGARIIAEALMPTVVQVIEEERLMLDMTGEYN
jgi:hypothetical protein